MPDLWAVGSLEEFEAVENQLKQDRRYALRSSNLAEDHIDGSQAGLNETLLRVAFPEIRSGLEQLFEGGMTEVAIQEFIQPKRSGVAFVRWISAEIEWVDGHLEKLLEGTQTGNRLYLFPTTQSMASDADGFSL